MGQFNVITDQDWSRELKRARKYRNTISEQIRQLTDKQKQSIIQTMSNISKYLPERSEYSDRVVEALKPYENVLYVVGSNARKTLYGLKTDVKDYDFVLSTQSNADVGARLEEAFPSKVTYTGAVVDCDCETFTLKLRLEPIDQFLYSVRFAGDGLAVRVSDGRPLTLPEYMSLPPVVQIIPDEEVGNQKGEWLHEHVKVLEQFQTELYNAVQSKLADEPVTGAKAS